MMPPTLELTGGWETVLHGPAREVLERSVLPDYLRRQRWFGGKARQIEAVRLAGAGELSAAGGSQSFLALFEVRFADGGHDLYFLPLGIAAGEPAERIAAELPAWVLARLRGPAGTAVLHDALADDATCTALLAAVGQGREFAMSHGRMVCRPTAAFAQLRGDPGRPLPVVRAPAASSNTLIEYDRRLLLKLFRRLTAGINPDDEIGRFLTEKTSFTRVPRLAGAVELHRPGAEPVTLAILQELVIHQADGWRHALAELARYYERVTVPIPPVPERETVGPYLHAAATLGRRTGELHLALVSDPHDPAFAPEPWSAADRDALQEEIRAQHRQAVDALTASLGRLPEAVAPDARRLLAEGPAALARLTATPAAGGGQNIRVHGDYHLGQVLWVENDYVILDFEGEPMRPIAERRAKQSPLKDVAGMLRSYHYAAYAGLFAFTRDRPADVIRLGPWAELWQREASASFLGAYRTVVGASAILPQNSTAFAGLLGGFMLAKAFYELAYELNNRPDWARIPLRGILALLKREVS